MSEKHRKDTRKSNSILACKHFREQRHNFNKHTKFIIIDKPVNLHGSKQTLREMLVVRENFWIQKLVLLAKKKDFHSAPFPSNFNWSKAAQS